MSDEVKIGIKHDKEKTQWNLLMEMKAILPVVDVLTYGAKKYAPRNYKFVKGWRWRYFAAAFRHMYASQWEKIDQESGFPHLAHAIACLLMMLDNELNECADGDVVDANNK